MNRTLLGILPLAAALLLAACSAGEASEPPLKGATIGGPFTLTSQDGARFGDRDLRGSYRLIYFGYTYCPDICPVDLQYIGQGLRQFERDDPKRARQVRPVFISTDPERDTPAVLKQYVAAFHPRLIGLTGAPEEVAKVARQFGVYYTRREAEGVSGYLVDHTRIALLFGPGGEPLAIVPHEEGAGAVAAELDRWVT